MSTDTPTEDVRHGAVYIAEVSEEMEGMEVGPPGTNPRFFGHWEQTNPRPKFLEEGPGWDDPAEAVQWGRQRARVVFIRLGRTHPQRTYSAGDEHPDPQTPRWSPDGTTE